MENMLMPAEVANRLGIGVSTLRKYSLLLEDNGVTFKRTTQNSRQYEEIDVITLQRMITLIKDHGVTVENAAYTIAKSLSEVGSETTNNDAIYNGTERYSDDVAGVTLNEVRELKYTIQQQTETIEQFRVAQEKRDQYFLKILEDLNGQIQQLKEQKTLPEPEKISEEEPAKEKVDPNDRVARRKSILARLFGK